jgi:hypothetical protein
MTNNQSTFADHVLKPPFLPCCQPPDRATIFISTASTEHHNRSHLDSSSQHVTSDATKIHLTWLLVGTTVSADFHDTFKAELGTVNVVILCVGKIYANYTVTE